MFNVGDDRKSMHLSCAFLELGEHDIRSGNARLTRVIVRRSWFPDVEGGWGGMFAQCLKLHLLGPNGLATAGAPVAVRGRDVRIFASSST